MTTAKHYYESHITISPVFDSDRDKVSLLAKDEGFKLAHLIMQKSKADIPEESKRDTFMTSHGKDLEDLSYRTIALVIKLECEGFNVLRYKIEDIVVDSRIKDEFNLLKK